MGIKLGIDNDRATMANSGVGEGQNTNKGRGERGVLGYREVKFRGGWGRWCGLHEGRRWIVPDSCIEIDVVDV